MSWICPHQDGEYCKKRQLPCKAGDKGCVLEGRIAFVEEEKKKRNATQKPKGR